MGTSPPPANDCAPDCAPKDPKRDPLALADDLLRAAETASDPALLIAAARVLLAEVGPQVASRLTRLRARRKS